MEEFMKVVKCIKDFWFTIVSLPPKLDLKTSKIAESSNL